MTDLGNSPHQLLVADSFRVRSVRGVARVRGLRHHVARFTRSVTEVRGDASGLDDFLNTAARAIVEHGEGFPRLELWGDAEGAFELAFSLRPLPALQETLELRSVGTVTLHAPHRKGPNIRRLAAIRESVGAEPLLVGSEGDAREGATTALVSWEGDAGFFVESRERVHSVTELLVREIADVRGTPLSPRAHTVDELARQEVWALNALHGIRVVTSIDDISTAQPNPARLAHFRQAIDNAWEPVNSLLTEP